MNWLFRIGSLIQRLSKANLTALKELKERAEKGDPQAQFRWGEKHYEGIEGFARNYAEAARWFQSAAEQGNADAQLALGMMYWLGRGVACDRAEGYKWTQLAADQGHRKAAEALGSISRRMTADEIEQGKQRAASFPQRRSGEEGERRSSGTVHDG